MAKGRQVRTYVLYICTCVHIPVHTSAHTCVHVQVAYAELSARKAKSWEGSGLAGKMDELRAIFDAVDEHKVGTVTIPQLVMAIQKIGFRCVRTVPLVREQTQDRDRVCEPTMCPCACYGNSWLAFSTESFNGCPARMLWTCPLSNHVW